MTFHRIKEEVVDGNNWTTEKKLKRFAMNLALFVGLFGFMLCMISYYVMSLSVTLFVILFTVLLYSWIFDWCAESQKALKVWMVLARFWVIWIAGIVAVGIALQYMMFI